MKTVKFLLLPVILLALLGIVISSACAGAKGDEGPPGNDGTDGVGIESAADNGDGTFTLTFSDGTTFTTDNFTGPQGPPGANGTDGTDGQDGEAGPNWIAAMGIATRYYYIPPLPLPPGYKTGSYQTYAVNGVSWDSTDSYFRIDLAFELTNSSHVVLVTRSEDANADLGSAVYWADGGDLCVRLYDAAGNPETATMTSPLRFSFCVLKMI